ncbi:MAG: intradiol ring-cleavage dioxygenase [Fimbriimonas sp.]
MEIPMDNDDAIVGRILSRREALTLAARTGAGLMLGGVLAPSADAALQAKAQREVKLVASPALTEGPFFLDGKLDRSDLLADTKRPAVVEGLPLALAITIYKLANGKYAPLKGAAVDVWHCDALGVYSGESHPMNHENTEGQNWLRGYQTTDADGVVKFATIFPGWYPGRTTHIHFKVRHASKVATGTQEFTSQLFFPDALADEVFAKAPYKPREGRSARNANDMIFRERQVDGTFAGDHLMLELARKGNGFDAKFAVALV